MKIHSSKSIVFLVQMAIKGTKVPAPLDQLEDSLAQVEKQLASLLTFVESVQDGKVKATKKVAKEIWDSLSNLPTYGSMEKATKLNEPKTKACLGY